MMPKEPRPTLPEAALDPPGTPEEIPEGEVSGSEEADSRTYVLRLYIANHTPKSVAALANLKKICAEYLAGRYQLEVIDLVANPQMARGDQILAIPTLVLELPLPVRKIIGDLSNTERVLVGLDLHRK